nr:hypothetical protein [Pandoravirus massiliensis]
MFWRRRGRRAPTSSTVAVTPLTETAKRTDGDTGTAPAHSYDDTDYWERERLDPWAPARRAEEQVWARRRADDAERARVAAEAVRNAGQCDVVADAAAVEYAVGFLSGVGLVAPAEFDARVDRAARIVMAVGDAHVPVAFDARDVVRSLVTAGVRNGAGLFQSDLVTCLMTETDVERARALAKTASDREIARLLFQTPRVKPVVDAYGVWGLASDRSDGAPSSSTWVLPKGAGTRGPGLHAGGRPTRAVSGSPWNRYVDMYGSADDAYDASDLYADVVNDRDDNDDGYNRRGDYGYNYHDDDRHNDDDVTDDAWAL